jgi:hypothetical protein
MVAQQNCTYIQGNFCLKHVKAKEPLQFKIKRLITRNHAKSTCGQVSAFYVYCHVFGWLLMGFWIGFIDHFNRELISTHNYSAIADLWTLQITRAHRLCSQPITVSTSRFLVTASNNGHSSASGLKSSLNGGSVLFHSHFSHCAHFSHTYFYS